MFKGFKYMALMSNKIANLKTEMETTKNCQVDTLELKIPTVKKNHYGE